MRSETEATLYVKRSEDEDLLVASVYVDDILLIGSKESKVEEFKESMKTTFEMSDLGRMSFFLGMEVKQMETGIFLHQKKYAEELLSKFCMGNSKPVSTPFSVGEKLFKEDGTPQRGIFKQQRESFDTLKGTVDYGIYYGRTNSVNLIGFSDSDWAGNDEEVKSISGNCFTIGTGVITWSSKKQGPRTSINTGRVYWGYPSVEIAISIAKNPVFHSKTKHIKVKYHVVRYYEEKKEIKVVFSLLEEQLADIYTKPLSKFRFEILVMRLGMDGLSPRRRLKAGEASNSSLN
ncbi:uncharacterized mitochondrial protein AtMg00810-like [Dioscorea cayenensis subsp. rotundata]|uniref:Uncharacterized mitochondrial protein AtMg00810-like n=1 Tax=Dioscorea cayennensis subsp. rotundata TaxID=55577 RepID=A0AB40C6P4_DIOCR|nr:uncharacterized mitochondrial protein AtMg00810-like [Dioscorea cayenensis subsp. rotundata]